MSDLNAMLGKWREGTDGLMPRPELVPAIQAAISKRALQPPLAEPDRGGTPSGEVPPMLLTVLVVLAAAALGLWLVRGPLARVTVDPSAPAPVGDRRLRDAPRPPGDAPLRVEASDHAAAEVAAPAPLSAPTLDRPATPAAHPAPQGSAPVAPVLAHPARAISPVPAVTGAPIPRIPAQPAPRGPGAVLAYPFTGVTLEGKRVSLTELRGKIVVLDFWEIGCGFCWEEMPALDQIRNEHAGKDIVFLSVALNTEQELREPRERKHPFPVIADPEEHIIGNYPVHGYPSHVVVDRLGRIVDGASFSGSGQAYSRLKEAIRIAQTAPAKLPLRTSEWIRGECALSGTVVSKDGPVAEAWVVAQLTTGGESRRGVTTDREGRFSMKELSCADYYVNAGKRGFTDARGGQVSLRAGEKATIDVRLPTDGAVEGTVLGGDGKPLGGAWVESCVDWSAVEPLRADTDKAGRFKLAGLEVGEDKLVVVKVPGASAGAQSRVRVVEGESTPTVLSASFGRARVHLTGKAKRVQGVLIEANPVSGANCREAQTGVQAESGSTTELLIPVGTYRVRARYTNFDEASGWTQLTVQPTGVAEATVSLDR